MTKANSQHRCRHSLLVSVFRRPLMRSPVHYWHDMVPGKYDVAPVAAMRRNVPGTGKPPEGGFPLIY
jgi:hypothetical protein